MRRALRECGHPGCHALTRETYCDKHKQLHIRNPKEFELSKLPMRQLTMLERKKNPTARALIHLFPTLTQIYSCLEIY